MYMYAQKKFAKITCRHSFVFISRASAIRPRINVFLQPFSLRKYTLFTRIEEGKLAL